MRRTWLSPRALGLHATVLVAVPGFLWLGWWQLHRALGGNDLSWAYTVEWPFFSAYAVFMWWRLVHDVAQDRVREGADTTPEPRTAVQETDDVRSHDDEMAAYNSYLASLHTRDRSSAP